MRALRFVMLSTLFVLSGIALAQSVTKKDADSGHAREKLIGSWHLVSMDEPGPDGNLRHITNRKGQLIYTLDGHMSVQVMYRNPPQASGTAPVQYAQGGYEASFGRYEIDDGRTFTFHVEGALVRTLIGKDLNRVYQFSGSQLIVKSPDPNEHWRAVWERY